ncbi:hypothetical protein HDU97_007234 [Phlyctochytrium planicorne]|nr:hypothetical protein HDU97_007234 [Phlyctochytrium planicorne]
MESSHQPPPPAPRDPAANPTAGPSTVTPPSTPSPHPGRRKGKAPSSTPPDRLPKPKQAHNPTPKVQRKRQGARHAGDEGKNRILRIVAAEKQPSEEDGTVTVVANSGPTTVGFVPRGPSFRGRQGNQQGFNQNGFNHGSNRSVYRRFNHAIAFHPNHRRPEGYETTWLKDFTPICMAAKLFRSSEHFIYVQYSGDPNSETDLKLYQDFLHKGFQKWGFLTATRSQLPTKSCIMAPRMLVDPIRECLDLTDRLSAGKMAKYSGLLFNLLDDPIVEIRGVEVEVMDDVERSGYNFTDGCGIIGRKVARDMWVKHCVAKRLPPQRGKVLPSVFQIRMAGVKGLLVVDPFESESKVEVVQGDGGKYALSDQGRDNHRYLMEALLAPSATSISTKTQIPEFTTNFAIHEPSQAGLHAETPTPVLEPAISTKATPYLPRGMVRGSIGDTKILLRDSMKKLTVYQPGLHDPNPSLPHNNMMPKDLADHVMMGVRGYSFTEALNESVLNVAVIGHSKHEACGMLNGQIVSLLLERGVDAKTLINMDLQYKNAVMHMLVDIWAMIDFLFIRGLRNDLQTLLTLLSTPQSITRETQLRRFWETMKNIQSSEIARWSKKDGTIRPRIPGRPELQQLLDMDENKHKEKLNRFYLPVNESRRWFGIADAWGKLKPGQCFVRISAGPGGEPRTVTGNVLVTRNPCYHPGDLVTLEAVDVPELNALVDVIAFSVQGDRPTADLCSGGDLDGDTFMVIWDWRIVSAVAPSKPFNYNVKALEKLILDTGKKFNIKTYGKRSNFAPKLKSQMITRLTTKGISNSIIGIIDSMLVNLRKFNFYDDEALSRSSGPIRAPNGQTRILSRQGLVDVLNAIFSAGIDDIGINIEDLFLAIARDIANGQTTEVSDLEKLLQEGARAADNAINFQSYQSKYREAIWNFFSMSVEEETDSSDVLLDPYFLEKYRPQENRETIDIAMRVIKLAEKMISEKPTLNRMLTPEILSTFQHFLAPEVVVLCSQVAADIEGQIEVAIQGVSKNHLYDDTMAYKALLAQRDELKRADAEGEGDPSEIYDGLEKVNREIMALARKLENDIGIVDELKTEMQAYQKLKERHSGLNEVVENAYNTLLGRGRKVDTKLVQDTGKVLKMELEIFQTGLPIYDSRRQIVEFLKPESPQVALILSATGSGKSTCLPHFLANDLFFRDELTPTRQILVAQPRRQATLSLADRLAMTRNTNIGQEVGSHIGRSKAKVNKFKTIINCTTYGILVHYARKDPSFKNYSVIVLDEVHEDSPDLYFLFSIVKRALRSNRDLRVMLMSAKVDSVRISSFFESCNIIEVSGRSYPIVEHFEGNLSTEEPVYTSRAIEKAIRLHVETEMDENPDILVFLPLSRPIEESAKKLQEVAVEMIGARANNLYAFGLHSGVDDEDKQFILDRGPISKWMEIQRRIEEEDAEDDEDEEDEENSENDKVDKDKGKEKSGSDRAKGKGKKKKKDDGIWAEDTDGVLELLDETGPTVELESVTEKVEPLMADDFYDALEKVSSQPSKPPKHAKPQVPSASEPLSSKVPTFDSISVSTNPPQTVPNFELIDNSDLAEADVMAIIEALADLEAGQEIDESKATIQASADDENLKAAKDSLNEFQESQEVDNHLLAAIEASKAYDEDLKAAIEASKAEAGLISEVEPATQSKRSKKKEKRKEREEKRRLRREQLEKEEEEKRVASSTDVTRRVIFCTNIAETSLTFPKVGYVIDCGLQFNVETMPILNIQKSGIQSTTKVSAVQRKGRAGRLGPGTCYRLYSAEEADAMEEQTFSNPDQLDYMILSILDMYGTLDNFDWFTRPTDEELEWTISVLLETGMIESADDTYKLTPDGRIAMDLGRNQCSVQTARFLMDVWNSKACTPRLKQHCVVIAAMQAARATKSFGRNFSYTNLIESAENFEEEIECPEELHSLPASICKLNVYWIWRRAQSNKRRKKLCKTYFLRGGDMEEIHNLAEEIMKCMKSRHDGLVPENDWFFDPEDWDHDNWGQLEMIASSLADPLFMSYARKNGLIEDDLSDDQSDFSYDGDVKAGSSSLKEKTVEELQKEILESFYHEADATSMSTLEEIAFILDHLTKAFFTNLTYIDGINVETGTGRAEFLINGKLIEARMDRKEISQFGHDFSSGLFLFHGVNLVRQQGQYYLSHLDRIPVNRYPSGFPSKYIEHYQQLSVNKFNGMGVVKIGSGPDAVRVPVASLATEKPNDTGIY